MGIGEARGRQLPEASWLHAGLVRPDLRGADERNVQPRLRAKTCTMAIIAVVSWTRFAPALDGLWNSRFAKQQTFRIDAVDGARCNPKADVATRNDRLPNHEFRAVSPAGFDSYDEKIIGPIRVNTYIKALIAV
ncbi:hypothetical protein [Burkholderia gladioli]|uniref:hypothetical protein n=1 Tax=Burkholderia gladioli TaxID=28095 RepID=UPI001640D479|nr:hypothetical protein [Burkholderia gladioli]MBU9645104.1 hypothetical protein [Burkholderia gladioli]MDN7495477.1 hypothetical protein [Burkholderia gladioli]MDN7598487.1 hypothetical protein [Burkholderia gladioli]